MKKHRSLFCLVLLGLLPIRAMAADQPNILFILVDDLAWSDLQCYGHPWHETPHLNRLAEQGMRFTTGLRLNRLRKHLHNRRKPLKNKGYQWGAGILNHDIRFLQADGQGVDPLGSTFSYSVDRYTCNPITSETRQLPKCCWRAYDLSFILELTYVAS